jgi:hypothetical protein
MRKTSFVLVALVFMVSISMLASIVHNDIVPVFPEGEQAKIESRVIEGAVHFLEASSQANLLLKEYEKSARQPFNYQAALEYTDKAIYELEISRAEYGQAVNTAKDAGYVTEMIQKFKDFDYDSFCASGQLNGDTMASVKAYLSAGNIVGAYRQNTERIDDILLVLVQVREKIAAGQLPDISLPWKLLQLFSEAALFGNYCTMTAHSVFAR